MANFTYEKGENKYVFHYELDAVAANAPAEDFTRSNFRIEVKNKETDETIAELMAKFENGQMTELKHGDDDVLEGNEDLGVKFMEAYTARHTEAVQAARAEAARQAAAAAAAAGAEGASEASADDDASEQSEDSQAAAEEAARLAAEQAAEQARIAGFTVAHVELQNLNLATQTVELNVIHAGADNIHAPTHVEATFEVAEDGAITFNAEEVEGGDYADAKNDAIEAVMKAVAPEGERPGDEDADGNQAAWDAAAATYELLDGVRDGITRAWTFRIERMAIAGQGFNSREDVKVTLELANEYSGEYTLGFNEDYTEVVSVKQGDDVVEGDALKNIQDFYAAAVADSDVSNIHSRVLEAAKEVTGLEFVGINVVPNKTPHTATFYVTQKGYAEAIRVTVQLTNDAQAIQGEGGDKVPGLRGAKLEALKKLYADKVDGIKPEGAAEDAPAPKVDSEVKKETLAAFNRQITSFKMDITAKGLKVMAWDAGANKLVPWTEAQHGAIESGDGARGALDKHFVREITAKFGDGKDQKDAEGNVTEQRSFSLLAYPKNGQIVGLLQLNGEGKHADFEGDKAALIIDKANADIKAGKQVASLKLMSNVDLHAGTAEVEVELANGTKETLVATFDEHFGAITDLAVRQVPTADGEGTEPAKSEIIGDRVAVANIRAAHTAVVSEEDETLKFESFFQAVVKVVKTQAFVANSTVEKIEAAGEDEAVKYKVTFQNDADGLAGVYAGNVYEITEKTPLTVTQVANAEGDLDNPVVITPNRGNAKVFELLATVVCDKVDGNEAKPEDPKLKGAAARMRDALRNTANFLTYGNKYNVIGKRAQVDTARDMAALHGMDAFKQGWKHPLYYTANFVKGLVGAVVGAAISAVVQPFATAAQEASRLRMRLVAVRKHAIAAKHGAFFDAKTNDYYTMEGEPAARANKTNEQLHALPLAENYKGNLAFRAARAIFWDIPKGVAVAVASAVMMLVRIALAPVEGIVYGVKDAIEANTSESILTGKRRGIVRALTMTFDRVKMLDRRGMKVKGKNPQKVRQTGIAKLSFIGAMNKPVQRQYFFGKDLFVTLPLVLALIGGLSMAAFILFAPLVPAGIPVVSAVFAWVNTVAVPFLTGFAPLAFIASLGTVLQATALAGVVAAGTWAATYVAEVTLFAVAAVTKLAGQLLNVLNPFSADRADKTHMAVAATTPEAALKDAMAKVGKAAVEPVVEKRARDEFSTAWNLFKASMRTWWNTPKELRAEQKAKLQAAAKARSEAETPEAKAAVKLERVNVRDLDLAASNDALKALMVAAKDGEPAEFSIAKPDFDAAQRAYAQSYVSDSLLGGLVRTAAAALRTAAGNQEDMTVAHDDLQQAATVA